MTKIHEIVKAMKDLDVSILGENDQVEEWVSTGCVALDSIMGGGIPVGRVTEMFGDPSSGKSLIASQAAGMAQQEGGIAAYLDSESTVSKKMMQMLGVNIDDLIYEQPNTVEEVFATIEQLIAARAKYEPDKLLFVVWDSIAATSAQAEMDNEVGKANYGLQAKLISQSLRKITRVIAEQRVCLLFLNQIRENIGVMFGDKDTTFGGLAVGFHSSVRVKLDLCGKLKAKDGKHITGLKTRATCIKNKTDNPFQFFEFPIYFGSGVDDAEASFNFLKESGLLKTNGNTYILKTNTMEVSFMKSQWPDLYNENYDDIAQFIMDFEPNWS